MVEAKVQEKWKEFGTTIKETLEKVEKDKGGGRGRRKGWWNEECGKKRKNRRELRAWRKELKERDRNIRGRREHIKSYVREKDNRKMKNGKEKQRKQEQKDRWRIISSERKRWKELNKNIELEEWEGFFCKQLGEVENKIIKERIEKDLEREEINKIIRRLSNRSR
ncbi:PREDICTED: protein PXR1-like [Atta colombica]|uniref:protein PXR1-like n=1 Tax=Atta colombica TaxID=520822 RepID=UPI00084CA1F6|nr:PREDICTED: protein PXR1-like [Atta colombica]